MDGSQKRLSTGISGLDRQQELGGLPAGSTIGVVSPPLSMAHLLAYHLFETGRQTRYVSTTRRAEHIKADVERSISGPLPKGSGVVDVRNELGLLPDPVEAELEKLEEGSNFVLDTATAMEGVREGPQPFKDYRETIRSIVSNTYDRDGVSYVYFVSPDVEHLSREEWELLHSLDGAFVLTHNPTNQDVESFLHVHKLRGFDPNEDAFRLELDLRASIDPSENIG